MTKTKKLIITGAVLLCAVALLCVMLFLPSSEGRIVEEIAPPQKVSLRIRAVGDNLIHSPIYNSCKTPDGFNFDGLYENIKPYLSVADIAAINQETIFVEDVAALSGYPAFGTPPEVGESVVRAGFNLITHATNHTYDKGYNALMHTMKFWSQKDVMVLGINGSAEKQQKIDIWEKDGLKIALLNFTYGLNGYRLPADKKYLVNIIDRSEENAQLIKKAEQSADMTVVFLHFGTEYTHVPTSSQKQDVEFFTENGADVIIGTHPHVVQPVAEHICENGNKSLVFYSLGNFVSNQGGKEKILGAMADVTISKENGRTYVEKYDMLPLVTHAQDKKYSAYMLCDYTDEMAKKHTRCPNLTVEALQTLFNKVKGIEVY